MRSSSVVKVLTEQISCDWLRDTAATIPHDQAIVELGVYQGGSLQYLAAGTASGHNAPLFGVDQWGTPGEYRDRPHLAKAYGRQNMAVAARVAPSATLIRDITTHAAQQWDGPPVGLLHIDANHDYQHAMADFRAWEPHLAPRAWVCWDDYWENRFPGVIQAVDELISSGELVDFERIGHHFAVTRLHQ